MRNVLALIGLVVVGFAAIGWYCGWYKLTVSKGTDGKPEIKTTVDTDKVTEDSSSFFKRMEQIVTDKVHTESQKSSQPAVTPGNTPGPVAPVKGGADTPLFKPGTSAPGQGGSR